METLTPPIPLEPFVWTKSADEILASIARFAQRTLATHAR
jgi:hypothetical protein